VTEYAFLAEARRLSAAVAGAPATAFDRPSPCPPWTAGELLGHIQVAMRRVTDMLTAPEPAADDLLITAPDYYRQDARFSPATNADRIATAQRGAARLAPAALAAGLERTWQRAWVLEQAAPPGRVVRTRHGDLMLLTEFLRTRVLELAAHGLDLATALDLEPWLTPEAAAVVADLALPPGTAPALRQRLGWDDVTLTAALTSRRPLTAAESAVLESHGLRRLALG
jgi:uncharacterized protein (TIGR03083 family)